AALGVFILWFCWFGFNGGSTVSAEGDAIPAMGSIFVTTNLAAAAAAFAVLLLTWIRYKKPDVSMTLNGALAGLVGITAGCDAVTPSGAAAIGVISGILVFVGIEFVDKIAKVDDPVGAVGVHGICGAAGTIMVGLFATDGGLFYGGGFKMLGIQSLGVISVIGWVAVTMTVVFMIIKKTVGLRVPKEEEILGLDICEHGLESAYADFSIIDRSGLDLVTNGSAALVAPMPEGTVHIDEAVPVQMKTATATPIASDVPITKIEIITKQNKFEVLKEAMDKIGITGMTVTQVLGYGVQGGRTEYYRGIKMETTLLPKIKVEIVVSKVPVDLVVAEAKKALYTGNIGDGKIFIYKALNVIKVRTGEEGFDALQDVE
ncbi:MAG: adenylate cyclase, partial [Clostridiaceae bacterium]|nr:adenylate cyclase [Clostridiaceae bacterium]